MNDTWTFSKNSEIKSAEMCVEIPGTNIISRFPLLNDTMRKDTMKE
jgi:hypothetical protein